MKLWHKRHPPSSTHLRPFFNSSSCTKLLAATLHVIPYLIMQSAPEVETTLARLSTYRNIRGVMVLTRTRHTADTSNTSDTAVLQTTGTVFEGDGGKRYASAVESIVGGVTKALKECDESVS